MSPLARRKPTIHELVEFLENVASATAPLKRYAGMRVKLLCVDKDGQKKTPQAFVYLDENDVVRITADCDPKEIIEIKPDTRKSVVSAKVPRSTRQVLEYFARREHRSVSQLVEEAVRLYVAKLYGYLLMENEEK